MVGVAQLVEPRVVIPVVVGSSPIVHPIFSAFGCLNARAAGRAVEERAIEEIGPLAQLVEQVTLNHSVRSSSLRRPTNEIDKSASLCGAFLF